MRYLALIATGLILALTATAGATSAWYEFSFTGADIWNSSPTNTSDETGIPQAAPRRYMEVWKTSGICTTWNYNGTPVGEVGALASDPDFNHWKASDAGRAFGIVGLNLWGANAANAKDIFGEKYLSQTTDPDDSGRSSWVFLGGPAGWDQTKYRLNEDLNWGQPGYSLIEWWGGETTDPVLTQANMDSFVFSFKVLVSNPETAFEEDGTMRMWFGASGTDSQVLDGVMTLTPVPEPVTMLGVFLGVSSLGMYLRKRTRV